MARKTFITVLIHHMNTSNFQNILNKHLLRVSENTAGYVICFNKTMQRFMLQNLYLSCLNINSVKNIDSQTVNLD